MRPYAFASSCDSKPESDNPTPEPTERYSEKKNTILYQLNSNTTADDVLCNNNERRVRIVIDAEIQVMAIIYLTSEREDRKEKPEIDAWFFSHAHSDHVNAFIALVNQKKDEFTVKKIYYNFK